jgi:LacI family transcriptional regulator
MKRISLRDIAASLDVSIMTVSLALRDSPKLPEETRARIKREAERLGYRPDPALSALTTYRHEKQTVRDYRTLAFLTNFPTEEGWKNQVYSRKYFEGATGRAQELGYRIEPFWMRQPGLKPARIAQILEARGIKGLLLAPVHAQNATVALDWDRFCAVSLCRALASPYLNVVDHNHTHSMARVWHELRRRGYRRVGYAVREFSENLTSRYWLASHLMEQRRYPDRGEKIVAPLVADPWRREVFAKWLKARWPDVVVSPDARVHDWLVSLGFAVPGDIGFAGLEAEAGAPLAGICQDFANVGIAAVDLLHLELMRSAYGIPSVRQMIGIDGYWVEGTTLRPPVE